MDAETQREELVRLADLVDAFQGDVAQVSRPAGIQSEIYTKHASHFTAPTGRTFLPAHPPSARRREWLDISRQAFVEGWRTKDHRLFDAAQALAHGEQALGAISCGSRK